MPEVFDPPPEIIAGFMAQEVDRALLKWIPLAWGVMPVRGGPIETVHLRQPKTGPQRKLTRLLLAYLRRTVPDGSARSQAYSAPDRSNICPVPDSIICWIPDINSNLSIRNLIE
jgi:hypothetical protein